MNYNTHKLNSHNHSHIIDRQDSVTGDTIKANNEVVFCSACQSVFLVESWEYMNAIHCNQTETLDFIPVQEKEIRAKKKNTLVFEVYAYVKAYRQAIIVTYSTLVICVPSIFGMSYIFIEPLSLFTDKIVLLFFALIVNLSLVIASINAVKKVKKKCYIGTVPLQIYQDRVILFDKLYNWENIKSITYKSNGVFDIFSKPYIPNKLRVHLENENIDITLPSKYPKNTKSLSELMRISEYKEITFYAENKKEYQFLEEERKNHEGNIILTKKTPF